MAAAIFKNNHLLACKRAAGRHLAGFWEFPGGKVEEFETKIEALEREIFEELEIRIGIQAVLTSSSDDESQIRLDIFLSRTEDEPKLTEAHDEMCWLGLSEIDQIEWSPLDRAAVECLRKNEYKEYWGGHESK